MQTPLPTNTLLCTQCGGELHPEEGQIFLTCPYCGSAVYLDKAKVVFHWFLAPTLDEEKARASLARWMSGNQTVKDLDKKSHLTGQSFEYFPVWFFRYRQTDGKEQVVIEPAAATSVSELRRLNLPAGDLSKYDPTLDAQAHAPTVPLEAALEWTSKRSLPAGDICEQALVHIPLYSFKYDYKGNSYTAVVEAGTGAVLANIFPAKAETPYLFVGLLTALVFLCLGTFPVIGGMIDDASGYLAGLGICIGLGLLAAPVLVALATWVAAKV